MPAHREPMRSRGLRGEPGAQPQHADTRRGHPLVRIPPGRLRRRAYPAETRLAVLGQHLQPGARQVGVRVAQAVGARQRRRLPGAAALQDAQVHRVPERGAQPLGRRDRRGDADLGAAASLILRVDGVRADQRDRADALDRQRRRGIAQQHEGGRGRRAQYPPVGVRSRPRRVDRAVSVVRAVQGADHPGDAQQAQHLRVDLVLRHLAALDRRNQCGAPRAGRARHHQVQPGQRGALGRTSREPVGDDDPGEAPLPLEHVDQQFGVLGHRGAVDVVVAGHHQGAVRLGDAGLERDQVQLAQRALGHPHVDRPAVGLRVVAHEVLGGGRHPGGLQTPYVRGGDPGGQHRVLAEELEAAPAVGAAHEVQRRPEDHVDALSPWPRPPVAPRPVRPGRCPRHAASADRGRHSWRNGRPDRGSGRARRPARPSMTSPRSPMAGSPGRLKLSRPVSSAIFWSRVSAASRSCGAVRPRCSSGAAVRSEEFPAVVCPCSTGPPC